MNTKRIERKTGKCFDCRYFHRGNSASDSDTCGFFNMYVVQKFGVGVINNSRKCTRFVKLGSDTEKRD